jgi:hypothetical protein
VSGEPDFAARMRRAEEIVVELERRGGDAAEGARELLAATLALHEAGFARMIAIADAHGDPGRAILRAFAADADVASLLLLHDLHPEPLAVRVRAALDEAGSALRHGGGRIESLSCEDGVVRVVVARTPHGTSARSMIEEALVAAAPDAARIEVEEIVASPLLPVERLRRSGEGAP